MFPRILSAGVAALAFCALMYPAQANQSPQQFIQIHQQSNQPGNPLGNQLDNSQAQSFALPTGGAVNISNLAGQMQIQTLDPTQPQRLLVRLKDQALRPYLKQQREQLRATGKLSRAVQQQLTKSSQSQLQRVQKSQNQLLGELRKQKLVRQVHGQFTQLTNSLIITAEAGSIEQIRRMPQVAGVYPDAQVKALLAESVDVTKAPQLWAMRDSQAREITGQGVTVAVLDTGIDYTHPDLGGCIGAGCKVAGGYNFIEGEDVTNPIDKHGHGTHVAGIIAAKGTLTGVAPDVTLYAYKVLSDQGWGMESGIVAALEKAVDPDGNPLTDDQIDIVNMSLGGSGAPDSPISEAANNAMAAGVVVVVAAGNSGSSYSTIGSPGNAEQVLTVGASDNNGAIAGFSSRGPISGKAYVKPELVAPGVEINSAKPGGSYVRLSGTSMATPHVAGGAALLKQLYPNLTPAELKTLMINTSNNLGQDVFTQGAGMMDLAQAANAKLLVSPAFLSAGSVDLSQPNWSANLSLTLKNISSNSLKVATTAPAVFPQGASGSVDPVGEQELAVGQETTVKLQLLVDTQTLPFADSATLHHEVAANVRYAETDIRLPLVFSKAAKLNIEFDGAPWIVHVINDDGSYGNVYYFNSCTEKPSHFSIDLKPGNYHLAALFYQENCVLDSLVFKESIALQDVATVSLSPADAIHELAVGTVTGADGNALSLEGMRVKSQTLEWRMTDINQGSLFFLNSGERRMIRISNASARIQMAVSSLFSLTETSPGVTGEYYLINAFFKGVQSPRMLDLDVRQAGSVDFTYGDWDTLGRGVKFALGMSQLRSTFEFVAFGTYWTDAQIYSQPISAKLFTTQSTLEKGEWYPDLGVDQLNDDPFAWNLQLMRTGSLAFPDPHSFMKLRGVFSTPDETNYRSPDNDLTVTDSAYLMAPAFYFSTFSNELRVQSMSEPYWFGGNFTIQRDAQQNNFFDLMSYQLYCDGELRNTSDTTGGNFNLPMGDEACNSLAFELNQPVRFLGEESTSKLRLEYEAENFPELDAYLLREFPEQLRFYNDGVPSRVLNGSDLEVQLDTRNMMGEIVGDDQIPVLEYQLSGATDWVPLTLIRASNRYFAKLPVLTGALKTSLRISLSNDQKGAKLVQTLNDIIVLGQAASGVVNQPPSFDPLPRLTVEATAQLTAYTLPPVFALDANDGLLAAVTTDLGPYSVGSHVIRWQATNSAGKKSTGLQSLEVQDLSGPVIDVPANITVMATGDFTDVPQPEVKAYDAVDGEIVAWTMDWKPFPIGTSSVIWNASDSRYNLSYIVQTITVEAASSSSQSQVSSSSSQPQASSSASSQAAASSKASGNTGGGSSGGGGAVNFWMLFLCSLWFCRFLPVRIWSGEHKRVS
ncbi:MAG: S8 family serine peptidase [Cellvibrio sp.]|uniref:S8 family peptidase n=1 Tax=Cellvibrio sp. TaxID=1965322 RepID=UPI00271BE2FF|nr:S8 family serine peptidase [Cellvibrio sp.]